MPVIASYRGPACPRCKNPVRLDELTDGPVHCPRCGGEYEARVFHPPVRVARVLQLAQSGPDAAGACANHPRNAAVTNCERCGIFICSLCELAVDGATYCPSCFDRLAQEGTLLSARVRFRSYGTLAGVASFVGLLFSAIFIGLPLGALALYYVVKGFRTRNESGAPVTPLVLAAILAVIDISISSVMFFNILKK
jgi:ribosomal protein L37AE/L43A